MAEDEYVNFSDESIRNCSESLFYKLVNKTDIAKRAYEFVRDEIYHSFDIDASIITAKASDVLAYKTGICHAKSNLLAALLRLQEIPCGFSYQHLTIDDDDSLGYCLHCYNSVFLEGKWIKLDARGNKDGVNAEFSLEEPRLAFQVRGVYDEYDISGIFAKPHLPTMKMLENSRSTDDIIKNIPDEIGEKRGYVLYPDISQKNGE